MQEQVAIIEGQKREQLDHEDAELVVTLADLETRAVVPSLPLVEFAAGDDDGEGGAMSVKPVRDNPPVPLDVLSPDDRRDLERKVMLFASNGAREFLVDDTVWGQNAPLTQMRIDLVLTDVPYGINKKDGISSDKEIDDDDMEVICKYWFKRLRDTGTVAVRCHEDQVPKWSSFPLPLSPPNSLVELYGLSAFPCLPPLWLNCRKAALKRAGFWVDRYSTRTQKVAATQNWLPRKAVREQRRGPQGVGYNYVVAHKVCLDPLLLSRSTYPHL